MRKSDCLNGCSEALVRCVQGVLAANKYIQWELLSCSDEGAVCRADFVYRDEARGSVSHLSYELNEMGQFGYITVEALYPSAVVK